MEITEVAGLLDFGWKMPTVRLVSPPHTLTAHTVNTSY